MSRITIETFAKVNLGLAVVGRRADGYHDIDTIFQTVSLSDTLTMEPLGGPEPASLRVDGAALPEGPSNLAWAAAAAMRERTGCPGVAVGLTKRIPVAAGLGGGSADAAGVLVGMNELFGLGIGLPALREIGLSIGSDVPFLIRGGTARGRGRGEVIDQLPALRAWFVLVAPGEEVSAADAYRRARIGLTESQWFIRLNCSAIQDGDVPGLAARLRNDLEAGVVLSCPVVATIRERLADLGVPGTVMSGSGPAVVGVAGSEEEAIEAASRMAGGDWRVHVVESVDAGCRVTHRAVDRAGA
jgi:4-diphosphocytidyl-2-C-methyl-D-erythritol kinase